MASVIIIGPGFPLRGGIANFNHRLAKEFIKEGDTCSIYSFSLQYPSFLFPGKTQFTTDPAPAGINIHPIINSINPFNWIKVGNQLKRLQPDLVIVRYWLPFMGPALGTILRRIRKNKHTKIVCIADNIIPHEKRPGDKIFTRYFLKACDGFITMSETVSKDLASFGNKQPAVLIPHPMMDDFGARIRMEDARAALRIEPREKYILFFGFIRKYKGLDLLLHAMADPRIRNLGIKLLVVGEYYEDENTYHELIEKLGISNQLIQRTEFIPDADIAKYFGAVDLVVQPYRDATQSGVTPLAYHFETPMLVTNVGGLPDLVPHEKAGLVVEPAPTAIADGILRFYEKGRDTFIPHLQEEKKKYGWEKMVRAVKSICKPNSHA